MSLLKIPSLSFCVTCKNRFYQIQQTLGRNLDDNRMFASLIEFVLVDFGSNDGLRDWVEEHFVSDLKSGYLRYLYTDRLPYWHASIAKNTAHIHAKNDILVNLDCDNFTGLNGGKFVIRQFFKKAEPMIFHQFGGDPADGTYGRISMQRELFYQIGGYDESFEPMGFQDGDIIMRMCGLGVRYVLLNESKYSSAIRNTKLDSIVDTGSHLAWTDMDRINRCRSLQNIEKQIFIANSGVFGLQHGVIEPYCNEYL